MPGSSPGLSTQPATAPPRRPLPLPAPSSITRGPLREARRFPLLIDKGIRINAVAPGPFWTPIQPAGQPAEKLAELGKEVPLGRPGQPVEITPVYVLLASQEGSYITGEIYGVTGGNGIA